jgi:hypothetical protein
MPCAMVHMAVAGRILEEWKENPRQAPVSPGREGVKDAFLHGALAPDMGFIPGTHRLVSEAAHYLRPGDLARRLLQEADTPQEEAFVWGWASHLLADVEIHPLVGRAVGERLYGDRERRVDAMENEAAHVSLEVGLDVAVFRSGIPLAPLPSAPFFPHRGRIRFLQEALAGTYGLVWDASLLTQHHLRAVTLTLWWPGALRVLPLRRPGAPGAASAEGGLARLARRRSGATALTGFLGPEAPRSWFLDTVMDRIRSFPQRFRRLVHSGLEEVGNPNLETGRPTPVGSGHPATDEAARKVERARRRKVPIPG